MPSWNLYTEHCDVRLPVTGSHAHRRKGSFSCVSKVHSEKHVPSSVSKRPMGCFTPVTGFTCTTVSSSNRRTEQESLPTRACRRRTCPTRRK